MMNKEKKSTMKGLATNDQADYYSGIRSITVNGNNAYELKGKFLDDLHNNAFSGANEEDAVEHIEYFLKIVDPIDEIEPTDEESSDLEETNNDDEQEIAYIVGNSLHYQELEWYEALKDGKLKEEALRNKAIMEGLINKEDESCNKGWRSWENFKNADTQNCQEYMNEHDDERHELCVDETHEVPVCQIKRYKMNKYSFKDDEKYVDVKEEACRAYQEIFWMMDEG
ncbi:hypothetical protein Tco_1067536 [Tanacetum coccineum]|uniref:Uncharacterized protein n=1 Tax=Tanacetum coccineum TaxID=301880 RepID=A0ABQ5HE19_9ASTR